MEESDEQAIGQPQDSKPQESIEECRRELEERKRFVDQQMANEAKGKETIGVYQA